MFAEDFAGGVVHDGGGGGVDEDDGRLPAVGVADAEVVNRPRFSAALIRVAALG